MVFVEKEDGIVKRMWLDLGIGTEENLEKAFEMLDALSEFGDFLIADWDWGCVEKLSDRKRVEDYLIERLEVFS